MTSIFASEAEMQGWLSKAMDESEGLADLITNAACLENAVVNSPAEQALLDAAKNALESLYITQVIFENQNISIDESDVLRPDFVLYAPEAETLVIVEIKNLAGPTRQAGTELGAYSCELRTVLPYASNFDLVGVLISPTWPALLRHFVLNDVERVSKPL